MFLFLGIIVAPVRHLYQRKPTDMEKVKHKKSNKDI